MAMASIIHNSIFKFGKPVLSKLWIIESSTRSVHQSVCLCSKFYESNPREEYRDRKQFDDDRLKKDKDNLWGLIDGFKDLRTEILKWKNEWKERFRDDNHLWIMPGNREKIRQFDNKEALNPLIALSDRNHSRCGTEMSLTGKELFQGFLNSRPFKDGRVKKAGYCFMRPRPLVGTEEPEKSENRRERLRRTNRNIKEKSQNIIKDLKDTKQQMKNRMEAMMSRENVWTIPNALSVMRMGMAPVVAYLILNNQYGPAIGVFAVAGVTDLLDGWIARVVPGQSSVMGSFLDPMADKILVGTLFISLTYMDLIPVPLTALIIGRDAILIMAGFYIRYQSLEPPRTLSRYFNVTHPTAQLAPTLISKVNTGVQLGLVGATLLSTILSYDLHPFLQFLWYSTATTTVVSAVGYIFAKDTVKLLRKKSSVKR